MTMHDDEPLFAPPGGTPFAAPTHSSAPAPVPAPPVVPTAIYAQPPAAAMGHPADAHYGQPDYRSGAYAPSGQPGPYAPFRQGESPADAYAHAPYTNPGDSTPGEQDSGYAGSALSGPGYAATGYPSAGYQVPGFPAPHGLAGPGAPRRSPRRERPRISGRTVALSTALALVVGGAAGFGSAQLVERPGRSVVEIPVATDATAAGRPTDSVASIAARVTPSVVSLEISGEQGVSSGSGFVMSADGYIITNNHVVAGATGEGTITVLFADGSKDAAQIVGRTVNYDLAVVKVKRTGLTPLVLGDSEAMLVGDPVIAIGAPLGLDGTVTTGIISARNRPVAAGGDAETAFINALQTDAAINPGNSGGPLVNAAGEVIGINSAIAQPPGIGLAAGSIGLGFAIPSNQARRTAQQLIETGQATYPVIGVLLDRRYNGEGVMVSKDAVGSQAAVTPGSAADNAGIRPGDVILTIDGRAVTHPDELIVAIRAKAPGDAIELKVRPDGGDATTELRMVLGEAVSQ